MKRKPAEKKRGSTLQEAAYEIGIHRDSLGRYCRRKTNPCPYSKLKNGQLRLDVTEVMVWMRDQGLSGKIGRPGHSVYSPALLRAKLRKENALAAKYELQVAREQAGLMDAEAVRLEWADLGQMIRTGFGGLAAELVAIAIRQGVPEAAGPELQTEIELRISEILAVLNRPACGGNA